MITIEGHHLQTQQLKSNYKLEGGRFLPDASKMTDSFHSDDEDGGGGKQRNKSRRELPTGAVATLKAWLLSPEHFTHPYPTPQDQVMLMQKTGIDKKQLKNWFTNARRRIWKPMLKKQLEQGKLATTGTAGGVAVPGIVPGLMVSNMAGQATAAPVPQPAPGAQEIQVEYHGNHVYQPAAAVPAPGQYHDPNASVYKTIAPPPGMITASSAQQLLSKTDSHAVLMELFARDQDLVRQATESTPKKHMGHEGLPQQSQIHTLAGQIHAAAPAQASAQSIPNQHPMKHPAQARMPSVPTLNSWPHFSSVSSLNNLGTMPGVKSITSLSAADLAKQGPVNTVGNLAQVKSVESMGKNDSYAFLEVFFGDRSSNNLSSMGGASAGVQRGVKRERDEDNDVGLSLEDESPAATGHAIKQEASSITASSSGFGSGNPYAADKAAADSSDTLKRAYDDAMAARGLMSVSRSSEKLTDLVLPAKMQRTLSQEFMRQQQEKKQQQSQPPQQYVPYQYTPSPPKTLQESSIKKECYQYPAQPSAQSDQRNDVSSASVAVPSATKCSICHSTNIDTQLRPCGHMFHEKCLKASLQTSLVAKPKCPICQVPIESALLAIPTEENSNPLAAPGPMQPKPSWSTAGNQGQAVSDTKG